MTKKHLLAYSLHAVLGLGQITPFKYVIAIDHAHSVPSRHFSPYSLSLISNLSPSSYNLSYAFMT